MEGIKMKVDKKGIVVLNNAKAKFPTNNLVLKTLQDVQKDSLSTALAEASKAYENKDFKGAMKQYLAISPANEDSLLGVAACYQSLDDFDNAIVYYKKAMNVAPKNAEIPYYIGYLYSEQQKWNDAEEFLKKSIALNPEGEAKNLLPYVMQNFTLAEYNEAVSLYESNNFESALTKFNSVLKINIRNQYIIIFKFWFYIIDLFNIFKIKSNNRQEMATKHLFDFFCFAILFKINYI